jgi:hypothetical protein
MFLPQSCIFRGSQEVNVADGTSIEIWRPWISLISILVIFGSVMYFGLSLFLGNLRGMLSNWKELCSTQVAFPTNPIVLSRYNLTECSSRGTSKNTISWQPSPQTPQSSIGRLRYLTQGRVSIHKLNFLIYSQADIRRNLDQRFKNHDHCYFSGDSGFGIVSR